MSYGYKIRGINKWPAQIVGTDGIAVTKDGATTTISIDPDFIPTGADGAPGAPGAPGPAGPAGTVSTSSFLASGTGAVSRTVESKLRDTVSVHDFNAVGDGTTNDTVQFQAALNAGHKNVIVPVGTYMVDGLTISAALTLRLETGATIKLRSGANSKLISLNANDIAIIGPADGSATLDCNNQTGSGGAPDGVFATGRTRLHVQGVTIKNSKFNAIHFVDVLTFKILSNTMKENEGSDVLIHWDTVYGDGCQIKNNSVDRTGTADASAISNGIDLYIGATNVNTVSGLEVSFNNVKLKRTATIANPSSCIQLNRLATVPASFTKSWNAPKVDFNICDGGYFNISCNGFTGGSVNSNTCTFGVGYGIELSSSLYAQMHLNFVANTVTGLVSGGAAGATANFQNSRIGNTIQSTSATGIQILYETEPQIIGNQIAAGAACAVQLLGTCPTGNLSNNIFRGTGSGTALQSASNSNWIVEGNTITSYTTGHDFSTTSNYVTGNYCDGTLTESTDWASYTPTVTAFTGSITAYTVNRARYKKLRTKLGIVTFDITITTAGTGADAVIVTLPAALQATAQYAGSVCGIDVSSAITLGGEVTTAAFYLRRYNNTYAGVSGARLTGTCQFETS